jgi:large subunit ribosomal protein L25
MSEITLNAELRTALGSANAGRLRATGKLPAVVYGKGLDTPLSIVVDHREIRHAFNNKANRELPITLVVNGVSHSVKLHQIQRDPVKGGAAHLDFMTV